MVEAPSLGRLSSNAAKIAATSVTFNFVKSSCSATVEKTG